MRLQTVRYVPILIFVLLSLCLATAWGQMDSTSQPEGSITIPAAADTYITNRYPDTNFGHNNYLELWYDELDLSAYGAFLLFRFEVQEALGPEAIIDTATLELYQIDATGPASVTIALHPILESWREADVTWNNQPQVYAGPFLLATTLDNATGWKQIDVTQFADDWQRGNNLGLELRGPLAEFGRFFESSNHNEQAPRLVIRYHIPTPTPTPSHTPTPSLTPTVLPTVTPTPSPTSQPPGEELDRPDLLITDIWPHDGTLCLQIMNVGDAPNEADAATTLYVDGVLWASMSGPAGLRPGARWTGCFTPAYSCSGAGDHLLAAVDEPDAIPEINEANNQRAESPSCDQEAPVILEGPVVEDVGQASVAVAWITSEDAESRGAIGQVAGEFSLQATQEGMGPHHHLVFNDLVPGTTYHGRVWSVDAAGNEVASDPFHFTTLPLPDSQRPLVALLAPATGRGRVLLEALVTDNLGISRVEFYADQRLLFSDYSPPFKYELDTWTLANGLREIEVRAFDDRENVAKDTRQLSVANEVDEGAPRVEIIAPVQDQDASGLVSVVVNLQDDVSLDRAYFFVEGVNLKGINLEGATAQTWTFSWDSTKVKNGRRRIGFQVFDREGREGIATVDLDVDNSPPPRPLLAIKTHSATRIANRLAILLTVENIGTASAFELAIGEWMAGFIPQAHPSSAVIPDTAGMLPALRIEMRYPGEIPPGATRTFAFTVVPALVFPNPPNPAIGDPIYIAYQNAAGVGFEQQFQTPISQTTDGLTLAEAREKAISNANYLVVSNADRLVTNYWVGAYDILDTMGRLALMRNGVVGLINAGDLWTLDRLLTPPGTHWFYDLFPWPTWAEQLHPNFSKPLGGYVLLVGETEILPAMDLSVPGDNNQAPFSDHIYSDVGGDGRPELIVGRIIGDDPATIRAPMEAAIAMLEGKPGHAFNYESALLISGPPAGSFVSDVQHVGQILQPRLGTVDFLHADSYFQAGVFEPRDGANQAVPHDPANALVAGHMLGGNQDEIILTSKTTRRAYLFDRQSGAQSEFAIPAFDGTGQDLVAAGDLLGDARDELIIADKDADLIYFYDHLGSAAIIARDLAGIDAMAAGDVEFDGRDELVLADSGQDRIWIGDGNPLNFTSFSRSFDRDDRLLLANILGDSSAEIIIIDWSANTMRVLDRTGKQQASHSFGDKGGMSWLAYIGKDSAVGAADLLALGTDQIVIAPSRNYPERVFTYYYNDTSKKFVPAGELGFTFEPGQILAGGQVYLEPGEAQPQEEVIIATQDGKIRVLDLGRFTQRLQPDLQLGVLDRDIIFWSGHGHVNVWDGAVDSFANVGVPMNFGGHHPVIVAVSCLTGNYQLGSGENRLIAETMLGDGAAVYIGATEESFGYTNREGANWLFQNWMKGESIGSAFTRLERAVWDHDPLGTPGVAVSWQAWIRQYNLYGDPKFGAPLSSSLIAAAEPSPLAGPGEPPGELTVTVPAYEVVEDAFGAGLDYVYIPGGSLWLEPGALLLPYQTAVVELPAGVTVENVLLTKREKYYEEMDVSIPVLPLDSPACECAPEAYPGDSDGVVPAKIFDWEVLEGSDSTSTLTLRIYPIQYNPQTAEVSFHTTFHFAITYDQPQVRVLATQLSNHQPDPESPLMAEILLDNPENMADFLLEGALYESGSGALVRGLELKTLRGLQGLAAAGLPIDLHGLSPGHYVLRLRVWKPDGRLQASHTVSFNLGNPELEIVNLDANPRPIIAGQSVTLAATVRNISSLPAGGDLALEVRDENGRQVFAAAQGFDPLAPGENFTLQATWPAVQAGNGSYRLVATVTVGGQSRQAMLPLNEQTGKRVYLPVSCRP